MPAPPAPAQIARWDWGSAFGQDFTDVRERDDDLASSLAQSVSDRAYSWEDEDEEWSAYGPSSSSGRDLLAHELTHVAQHSSRR